MEMRADVCLESWKSVYVDLVTTRSHLTFVCICVLVLEGSVCVSRSKPSKSIHCVFVIKQLKPAGLLVFAGLDECYSGRQPGLYFYYYYYYVCLVCKYFILFFTLEVLFFFFVDKCSNIACMQ